PEPRVRRLQGRRRDPHHLEAGRLGREREPLRLHGERRDRALRLPRAHHALAALEDRGVRGRPRLHPPRPPERVAQRLPRHGDRRPDAPRERRRPAPLEVHLVDRRRDARGDRVLLRHSAVDAGAPAQPEPVQHGGAGRRDPLDRAAARHPRGRRHRHPEVPDLRRRPGELPLVQHVPPRQLEAAAQLLRVVVGRRRNLHHHFVLDAVRVPVRAHPAPETEVQGPPGAEEHAGVAEHLHRPAPLLLDLRGRLARGAHLLPDRDVDGPLALGARRGAALARPAGRDRRDGRGATRRAARALPPAARRGVTEAPRPAMIRIAFIIDHLRVGGAQRHLLQVVRGLDRSRYAPEMWTASTDPGDLGPVFERAGVPVRTFGIDATMLSPRMLAAALRVARDLRARGVQIAHGYLFEGNVLAALVGTLGRLPVTLVSKRSLDRYSRIDRRVAAWLSNRLADRVLVNAEAVRTLVEEHEWCSPARITAIPNGVDLPKPSADASAEPRSAGPVVGMVGRLSWKKGYEFAIDAAGLVRDRIPTARWDIVGDGPLRADLEARAAGDGLGEVVRFLGQR